MTSQAMTVGDWITAVGNAIQALAIVVAGAWAYHKFVRGRTFHRRAELSAEASLVTTRPPVVRVKATMRNTGAADIPFRAKTIRVAAFDPRMRNGEIRPGWRLIAHASLFSDHDWIESQETIADDVLIPTPELEPNLAALRVRCIVYEVAKTPWYRRSSDGGNKWTGKAVIPLVAPLR